jgi:hypothetical protein
MNMLENPNAASKNMPLGYMDCVHIDQTQSKVKCWSFAHLSDAQFLMSVGYGLHDGGMLIPASATLANGRFIKFRPPGFHSILSVVERV